MSVGADEMIRQLASHDADYYGLDRAEQAMVLAALRLSELVLVGGDLNAALALGAVDRAGFMQRVKERAPLFDAAVAQYRATRRGS